MKKIRLSTNTDNIQGRKTIQLFATIRMTVSSIGIFKKIVDSFFRHVYCKSVWVHEHLGTIFRPHAGNVDL
jgi:hypothetical protein